MMASFAARPVFFEGQLLAAADLDELGDHARARDERHQRLVHRPGIVTGLDLTAEPATDANGNAYKRVFVAAGMAIDGSGREILVDEPIEVDAERFRARRGASADESMLFPVLLRSQYRARPPSASSLAMCRESGAPTRIEEAVEIVVGQPGDEPAADAGEQPIRPSASPAEGTGPAILLGFVKWSKAAQKFSDALPSGNGYSRSYAGINAATVAGMAGRVLVQPEPAAQAGSLAFELDDGEGTIRFGPLTAAGAIGEPLFSVNRNGDLEVKGTLSGQSARETILSASGRASDGLILPLPAAIVQDQLDSGEASVQIVVTPFIEKAGAPSPDGVWAAMVEECRVDADRRLHCRIAWMKLDFAAGAQGDELVSMPAAADYLMIATVKPGSPS